jgi:nucleoside-diphosphate-sugar epimerase
MLIKKLIERGHQVINIDHREADEPLARFVFADLTRREIVQPILEQVDAVCHLGEIPNSRGSESHDTIYAKNTATGAVVLQSAADLKLKRAIYTSSCQAYGCWDVGAVAPDRLPFDETLPLHPQNVYGLGKAANEGFARLMAKHHQLSVAIFRFPGVWSPEWGPRGRGASKGRSANRRHDLLDGFGTYVGLEDAARAYVLALELPRPGCEAYHFSAAEVSCETPLRDRLIQDHPDYPVLPADWPAHKSPMLCGKALEHFGWAPTWNIRDVVEQETPAAAPRKAIGMRHSAGG